MDFAGVHRPKSPGVLCKPAAAGPQRLTIDRAIAHSSAAPYRSKKAAQTRIVAVGFRIRAPPSLAQNRICAGAVPRYFGNVPLRRLEGGRGVRCVPVCAWVEGIVEVGAADSDVVRRGCKPAYRETELSAGRKVASGRTVIAGGDDNCYPLSGGLLPERVVKLIAGGPAGPLTQAGTRAP